MIDAPILKSGKETHYQQLPFTVIIFITQEDFFGKDLAKCTFTERCEEMPELKLEDGRLIRLDEIVTEVKQPEEWEEVKLNEDN